MRLTSFNVEMPTAEDDTGAAAERFNSSSTRLSSLSSSLNVEVSEPQSLHAFIASSAIPRPNPETPPISGSGDG